MIKVSFAKTVNYNGAVHLANTVFEVDPKDLPELKAAGCFVKEDKKAAEPVAKSQYEKKKEAKAAKAAADPEPEEAEDQLEEPEEE